MMKKINLVQNSEKWFEFRRGKIGGSSAKSLTGKTLLKADLIEIATELGEELKVAKAKSVAELREDLKDTPEFLAKVTGVTEISDDIYRLVAEKIAKPVQLSEYTSENGEIARSMADRGSILEDVALAKFNKKIGGNFEKGEVWQSDESDSLILSPDGIDQKNDAEAVEIKCLDSWKHIKAWHKGEPPTEYREQIIHYFVVNENLQKLYFVMFSDLVPEKIELLQFEFRREDIENDIYLQKALALAKINAVDKFINENFSELAF